MKLLCENATFNFLPAVRAMITRELMQKYNYSQTEVAKALGITQPAVSQYKKELRGQAVRLLEKNKEVVDFIVALCAEINAKTVNPEDLQERFCELCKVLRKSNMFNC